MLQCQWHLRAALTTASDAVSWPLAQNSGHSLGGPVAPNDEANVEPLSEIGILSVSVQVLRLQIVSKCVPDFCTAYIVPR